MLRFQRVINTIDAHTAGEPLRIITSGLPLAAGGTILEKRRFMRNNYDHLRKLLMLEPRGHSGMYGCVITPPVTEDGDFGVLFMHNEGYSTMCGHGIIGVTKVAVEIGMIEADKGANVIRIDTPAGRVTACAHVENGRVARVSFENVPSFVYAEGVQVSVDGIGPVEVDIAFGGAFYVFVEAEKLGVRVVPEQMDRLVKLGMEIKHKIMDAVKVVHPDNAELEGIYGTIITEPVTGKDGDLYSKNVTIFADGQIDRSPTGTGTAARIALLYKKGLLEKGMKLFNRSIIETVFTGSIKDFAKIKDIDGVVPEIGGTAQITGFHQFVLEPDDPLPEGFRITGG
ncbi:MAG: proline racemase family protein [Peptococcaceae bacterium]|nr:proline racemase family protein [Peptococcaceae bacterium]